MDNKLMYIPNDDAQNYPFHRCNYWLKSLGTASSNLPNSIQLKYPKFVSQLKKKHVHWGGRLIWLQLSNPQIPAFLHGPHFIMEFWM